MVDNSASGNITIVPYDENVREAHVRFATKMWPSKRRRREDRYIRWKFRGPSHGAVDGLLLALLNGEVVGQVGLIPAVLGIDGERRKCQWACDLMVDSSLRQRGIASLLFNAAFARGIVTLGSNPSAVADVAMKRIGFASLEGPAMTVFPLDPAHILSWKIPSHLSVVIPLVSAAVRPVFWWRGRRLLRHRPDGKGAVEKDHGKWWRDWSQSSKGVRRSRLLFTTRSSWLGGAMVCRALPNRSMLCGQRTEAMASWARGGRTSTCSTGGRHRGKVLLACFRQFDRWRSRPEVRRCKLMLRAPKRKSGFGWRVSFSTDGDFRFFVRRRRGFFRVIRECGSASSITTAISEWTQGEGATCGVNGRGRTEGGAERRTS